MIEQTHEIIWAMESEWCDCGAFLNDWGICEDCGSDGIDYDEDEDDWDMGDYDEGWDIYY